MIAKETNNGIRYFINVMLYYIDEKIETKESITTHEEATFIILQNQHQQHIFVHTFTRKFQQHF